MSWGVMGHNMAGWGAVEGEWRKGPWTGEEDRLLIEYVKLHGDGRWNNVARLTGLKRNGKSCRLRWVNYLRPDLKRGQITPHEEKIILQLHAKWGNRWSTIARYLPGRTDNEIKNYWRTHFKKKTMSPSDSPEKTKARLLRRQKFHQQQQYNQQLLYQQYNQQDQTADMMTDEIRAPNNFTEEIVCPSLADDQGLLYSMINDYAAPVPDDEQASKEDIVWGGLWDLDDFSMET